MHSLAKMITCASPVYGADMRCKMITCFALVPWYFYLYVQCAPGFSDISSIMRHLYHPVTPIINSNNQHCCGFFSTWRHNHSKCKELATHYLLAGRGKAQTGFPWLYLFPGFFFLLFSYFFSFMVIWGFGVGILDWVFGVGISVDGVWGLWCVAFWAFLVGALYINIKE